MLEVRLLYKKLDSYNTILENTVRERTAELRASEARFRRLTELASDWYWEQDAEGHFTNMSGPVMEMLGIVETAPNTNESTVHSNFPSDLPKTTFGHTELLNGWNKHERELLQRTIDARQPFIDFSFSRINANGNVQRFRVSGEPIFDQSCRFVGYRGIGIESKAEPTAALAQ